MKNADQLGDKANTIHSKQVCATIISINMFFVRMELKIPVLFFCKVELRTRMAEARKIANATSFIYDVNEVCKQNE